MNKKLLTIITITGLILSACGDDYEAVKGALNIQKPLTVSETEARAIEILKASKFEENNSALIREELITTIKGATTVIFEDETTGNYHVEMTVAKHDILESDPRIACSPTTKITPAKRKDYYADNWIEVSGVNYDGKSFNKAQVRCVTAACESMILVLENIINDGEQLERGSVAILLSVKEGNSDITVYHPMATVSDLFLNTVDALKGREACEAAGEKAKEEAANNEEELDVLDTTGKQSLVDSQNNGEVMRPAVIVDNHEEVQELPEVDELPEMEEEASESESLTIVPQISDESGETTTTDSITVEIETEVATTPEDGGETLRLKEIQEDQPETMPAIFPEDEDIEWIDEVPQ